MIGRRALLAGGAALTAVREARAQQFRDELRVCWCDGVDHFDPYRTELRTGLALLQELWDGLVWRDPQTLELRPLLATDWHAPDPLSWEFVLRRDVWFHDGSLFGPADVVATVARIRSDDRLAIPSNYTWLQGAEAMGENRVRLHLAYPFPPALDFIAAVLPILPAGAPAGAAIGSGPWRLDAVDRRTRRIALARHEAYWRDSPKGRARIGRLTIDQAEEPAAPYNALVSGRADWIWDLTPDQYDAIQQTPELQALRAESMRVTYLALDAAGRSDADGPLTFLPLRQAVCHAIDRRHAADLVAPGSTRVIDMPCVPTQYGCDPVAATSYRLDRGLAHELMQNAGFPDGFATSLVTSASSTLAEAVAHDLTKIGIRTTLHRLPPEAALARARAGQAPLFLGSWGSCGINDMSAFLPRFFDGSALDEARLPGMPGLLARAAAATDADQRRALYGRAVGEITAAACFLPLFVDAASYGIQRSLAFRPALDDLPRFFQMRWR